MLCKNCKREAKSNLKHLGPLCDRCFSKIFEKRIRKHVRVNRIFRKGDVILVSDKLCDYLVKGIVKDLPVGIFFRKKIDDRFIKKNKINKVVVPWTLDDEINNFLEGLFFNKRVKDVKFVKLLKAVSDDEAKEFARIKGLMFNEREKNKDIKKFISALSDKYNDVKFGLLKSVKEITKIS